MNMNSEYSIQFYNDNIINDISSSRKVSLAQPFNNIESITTFKTLNHNMRFIAIFLIHNKLQGKIRDVLRKWKRKTDMLNY
jgi:hypothetical protein